MEKKKKKVSSRIGEVAALGILLELREQWGFCNTVALQGLYNQLSYCVPELPKHLNLRKCFFKKS